MKVKRINPENQETEEIQLVETETAREVDGAYPKYMFLSDEDQKADRLLQIFGSELVASLAVESLDRKAQLQYKKKTYKIKETVEGKETTIEKLETDEQRDERFSKFFSGPLEGREVTAETLARKLMVLAKDPVKNAQAIQDLIVKMQTFIPQG